MPSTEQTLTGHSRKAQVKGTGSICGGEEPRLELDSSGFEIGSARPSWPWELRTFHSSNFLIYKRIMLPEGVGAGIK